MVRMVTPIASAEPRRAATTGFTAPEIPTRRDTRQCLRGAIVSQEERSCLSESREF